jgi:HEAT repeat protein
MSTDEACLQALERALAGAEPHRTIEEAMASPSTLVRGKAAEVAAQRLAPARLIELVSQSSSYSRRASAMDALCRLGRAALAPVIAGATSPDHSTSLFCIQVLGGMDFDEARDVLAELAGHEDLLLSQAAIEALGDQRDPTAVPLLVSLLSADRESLEADPWRAISAIIALGKIGSPSGLDCLLRLRVSETLRDTANEAITAIRRRGGEAR